MTSCFETWFFMSQIPCLVVAQSHDSVHFIIHLLLLNVHSVRVDCLFTHSEHTSVTICCVLVDIGQV